MTMASPRADREIADFADALLDATGQLTQIADHMVSYAEAGLSAPDALPPAEVLRNLLTDTLGQARPAFARADLRRATAILRRTVRTVEGEIYLVPADLPDESGPNGFDDA
jgi:hypothetical protein